MEIKTPFTFSLTNNLLLLPTHKIDSTEIVKKFQNIDKDIEAIKSRVAELEIKSIGEFYNKRDYVIMHPIFGHDIVNKETWVEFSEKDLLESHSSGDLKLKRVGWVKAQNIVWYEDKKRIYREKKVIELLQTKKEV